MNDKKLRIRMNKIRDAQVIITNEINSIYNENAENYTNFIFNETKLNLQKPFWCIVRLGNVYRNSDDTEVSLFQFDSPKEMQDFLGEGEVRRGEGEGVYCFIEMGKSHKDNILNQIVELEKKSEEEAKADRE